MLAEQKRRSNQAMLACVAFIALAVLGGVLRINIQDYCALAAVVCLLIACYSYLKAKGRSGWWMVLVLAMNLVGLLAIFLLRDLATGATEESSSSARGNAKAGWHTAAIAAGAVVLFIVMIKMAADAHRGYERRAFVGTAVSQIREWQQGVESYYKSSGRLPKSLADLSKEAQAETGKSMWAKATFRPDASIEIRMDDPKMGDLDGQTIIFRPRTISNDLEWDCTDGTMDPKQRPSSCRK